MNDSPTPETPSDQPFRLGRMLRLPRLSGKASAACLVAFFLATGLLIPGVVRLPLWIDFEIVLAIWWLGWLIVLAVLLYRGQRVTDDHQLGQPRNWLNALAGNQKPADPLDVRKRDSRSGWWDGLSFNLGGGGEGCLVLLGVLLAIVIGFFALWFLIEIAIPLVLFLLYVGARGMLAAVINDRHRCPGRLGRSFAWGLVWATAYTAPLAAVVWLVHYVMSQQA